MVNPSPNAGPGAPPPLIMAVVIILPLRRFGLTGINRAIGLPRFVIKMPSSGTLSKKVSHSARNFGAFTPFMLQVYKWVCTWSLRRRLIGGTVLIRRIPIGQRALPLTKVVLVALAGSFRLIVNSAVLPSVGICGADRAAHIFFKAAANLINLTFRIGISRPVYLRNIPVSHTLSHFDFYIGHQEKVSSGFMFRTADEVPAHLLRRRRSLGRVFHVGASGGVARSKLRTNSLSHHRTSQYQQTDEYFHAGKSPVRPHCDNSAQ